MFTGKYFMLLISDEVFNNHLMANLLVSVPMKKN